MPTSSEPAAGTLLWPPTKSSGIPDAFVRFGWLGVWLQLLIIAADVIFITWVLLQAERSGVAFGVRAVLVAGGLAVMLFTTVWFWRYARLGRQMLEPVKFPDFPHVVGTLWTGLWASVIGIVLSLALLFLEALHLLTSLLIAPQGGAAVAAAPGSAPFLSAFDGISLMGSLIVVTVELALAGSTLMLLFRTTGHTRAEVA
ncbi:MAG: DUF3611 family protein [Pseudomonadota bacterium]